MGTRKQYSRKIAAILTVLAMVLALFPVAAFAQEPKFSDIAGLKLAKEIEEAAKAGLVDGYPDGTFKPKQNVTRAEFAKMIVNALEKATGKALPTGDEPFSDVEEGQALYEYVVKAYNAKLIQGYEDGRFGYDDPIQRQQAAAIIARALGLEETEENFPDVDPKYHRLAGLIGAVAKAGLMQGYDNGNFGPTDSVQRDQAAAIAVRTYNYLREQQPELYEVTAVEAVSSKSIRVTFNKAVEDTSVVKFDVKRDGVAVELTAKWAEDKKSVDLESSSKLRAGTYTVTVSGLDFAEGKNTGSVKVEEETVAKIEILGDKLIRDKSNPHIARIGYKVYNQYSEDITSSSVASGLDAKSSAGTASIEPAGVVAVTNAGNAAWPLEAKVVLTLVHSSTGVTASKTLTVADSGQLTSFAFGNIIYPDDSKRIYAGRSEAAWIEVQATDPNGQPANEAYLQSAVTLVPQSGLDAEFVTKDGKPVIKVDTSGITAAGKYNLTAVVLSSPELTKSITLDVVEEPYPAKVELAAPEGVIAALDAARTVVIDLKVFDQFGNEMSSKDIVAHSGNITVKAVGAGFESGTNLDNLFVIESSGANAGKIVNQNAIPALDTNRTSGSITVVVTANKTGNSATVQLQVREQRKPVQLVLPKDAVTNLLFGATSVVKVGIKDQYGADYPLGSYTLEADSSDTNVVTTSVSGSSITLSAGQTEGTATITVRLLSGGNPVASVDEVEFSVTVAAPSSKLQYSLAEIPALYWDADGDGATGQGAAGSPYAEEIKVVAKDSSGKTYQVAPSSIVVATADGADFETGKDGNVWKVWSTRTVRPTEKVTGTLTVQLQTSDAGLLKLTGPVTISAEERAAVNIHLRDQALANPDGSTQLPGNAAPATVTYSAGTPVAYVAVEDQFGRYWVPGNLKVAAANLGGVTSATVSLRADGAVNVDSVAGSGSFDVVIQSPNGKTATIKVQVP